MAQKLSRAAIDQIAWETIKAKPVSTNYDPHRSSNYQDIGERLRAGGEWEIVWGDFLHNFYDHRQASFFAYPPPIELDVRNRALLAGIAEWLSAEFDLPQPPWVNQPQYFLREVWDPWEDLGLDLSEFHAEKLARSPEAFRKRNIAFEARNLIAL